jgi:hypothetical protein
MAIKLIANYSKRLGLPGFSSHQFSVSVETEVLNIDDVSGESARLYQTLQDSVDKHIQTTGFVPPHTNGNGHGNGRNNGHQQPGSPITPKQLDLINRVVRENGADKNDIESLSKEMFQVGVRQLNRMQASNLIDELFERYHKQNGNRAYSRRQSVPA